MFTLLVMMTVAGVHYPTAFPDRTLAECRSLGETVKASYASTPTVKIEYICVLQK